MSATYTKKVGTTEITIEADFGQASDQIMIQYSDCGEEAEWETTGKQVADFGHDPEVALAHFAAKLESL